MSEVADAFGQIADERAEIARISVDLLAARDRIDAEISALITPHASTIDELKQFIKHTVLEAGASAKTDNGSCTYVKGRKPHAKWDDAALNGYAVANPDILQFRSEGAEGKPSVRFKLPEVEL